MPMMSVGQYLGNNHIYEKEEEVILPLFRRDDRARTDDLCNVTATL